MERDVTEERLAVVRALNEIALRRGQTMAQMALQWTLRDPVVTSALIGASKPEQIEEKVRALTYEPLTAEELAEIDRILMS